MDPVEYLRGIKRRWRLVAAIVALALAGAWIMTSVVGYGTGKASVTATTSLLQASSKTAAQPRGNSSQTSSSGLQTIVSLVTVDQVASAAAKQVGFSGDPKVLAKRVVAEVDNKSGLLLIKATAKQPELAKLTANAFAQQLLAFLIQRDKAANAALEKIFTDQIARIHSEVAALDRQIKKYPAAAVAIKSGSTGRSGNSGNGQVPANTGTPADPLIAQRNAALKEIETISSQLQEVKARAPDAEGLQIVQTAVVGKGGDSLSIPSSLLARLAIAGFLGLLGGFGLALLLDRFDRRIRTRDAAEEHFGLPVLAEIPALRTRSIFGRRKEIAPVRIGELPPAVADAYRLLAAGLNGAGSANGSAAHDRRNRPRAILVTSAGPADGRGSVLAGLAATFAAVGRNVTVVSCDFRRPEVHSALGVTNERGVTDVLLSSNGGPMLSSALWQTPIAGVFAIPSGTITSTPDSLLSSPAMRRLLMEARQLSDVVLIDTAPILTSDASFLLPEVDGVLVVVKAGTTKPQLAERSAEMLKRLEAPTLGVVLTGNTEAALPRGYYRTRTTRQVILGAPVAIARGIVRAGRAAGRIARKIRHLRRDKAAEAIAPKTIVLDPPVEPKPNGAPIAKANGDRGFPRLTRRSGSR
ncbi:MAG: hypothetical protein ACRDJ1_02585 [Actinomycetota bacterium]